MESLSSPFLIDSEGLILKQFILFPSGRYMSFTVHVFGWPFFRGLVKTFGTLGLISYLLLSSCSILCNVVWFFGTKIGHSLLLRDFLKFVFCLHCSKPKNFLVRHVQCHTLFLISPISFPQPGLALSVNLPPIVVSPRLYYFLVPFTTTFTLFRIPLYSPYILVTLHYYFPHFLSLF